MQLENAGKIILNLIAWLNGQGGHSGNNGCYRLRYAKIGIEPVTSCYRVEFKKVIG